MSKVANKMKRREFVSGVMGGGLAACLGHDVHAAARKSQRVTLLHTNDTHSRIEPFDRGKYKGMGGIARRAYLIKRLRKKHPETLVVDAGDIFQGTPYFNVFRGQVEIKTMSMAGYDVATIGNHDFDLGADWFLKVAQAHASFPFVSSNLTFAQPAAKKLVKPFVIKEIKGWRIGFIGLGVRFRGLVVAKLHKGVTYTNPLPVATKWAKELREKHRCDAVVVLSHLGYDGYDGEPGDKDLARKVPGIDVIIGGHTHTFLRKPTIIRAPDGRNTHIFQVGHSGIYLGQIDLFFDPKKRLTVQSAVHDVKP